MVARVHSRIGGIAVPELPDGCGTLVDHISPAGIASVRRDGVCKLFLAITGKASHEELDADQTGADVAVEFVFGLFDYVCEDFGLE